MSDLRFAWRAVSRNPSFTLAIAGLLAAGIGVTTLIFSAVDAILLRPLPVRHPEQLVRFVQRLPRIGVDSRIPLPAYEALRDRATTISAVFGERELDGTMTEPAPAERIRIHLSTPNYFEALGVRAMLGRTLAPDDAKDNPGDPPAVLSYAFWQRRFNGDPGALGKTIRIDGHSFAIVGVLPREFNGFTADTAPQIRLPLRLWPLFAPLWVGHPEFVELDLAGRLKPGIAMTQAQAEARTIWKGTLDSLGRAPNPVAFGLDPTYPLEVASLEHGVSILRDRYGTALKFLIGCASFLLLMVCASVAGLLLARGAVRRQEIAVRLAVGAPRARLATQMLVESALLAVPGAIGGILVAAAFTPVLARLLPPIRDLGANRLALSLGLGIDRRVLLFSIAVSIGTVVLFGLAPAIAASRTGLESILRSVRSSGTFSGTARGRQALILVQVAMCTVLLTGAGLLIRTFERLRNLNPGFDPEHVVSFTIDPPLFYKPGMAIETFQKLTTGFHEALLQRVRETPGAVSVALAQRGVLRDRGMGMTVVPAGQRATQADVLATAVNGVTPNYFKTMGIPLLEGRLWKESFLDPLQKPRVVVNQAFAQRYFPGADPIGKRFGPAVPVQVANADTEIIGVVSDAKYRSLREPIQPTIFNLFSYTENPFVVVVKTRGKPALWIQPIRQAIASFAPSMPIVEVETLGEEVDASASGERLTAVLAAIFAVSAVLMSGAGIYGLLAYVVAQRRREIGIRLALGATSGAVRELIGRQALAMVMGGMILGLGAARAAAPLLASMLYGVTPWDASSLVAAAVIVLAIAALAAAIPASRAARIDPAAALRDDHFQ